MDFHVYSGMLSMLVKSLQHFVYNFYVLQFLRKYPNGATSTDDIVMTIS